MSTKPNAILFIRHAETALAGTFCGHTDPPLNERGWNQVAELVSKLRDIPIDAIYASDLQRAHATARALADSKNLACNLRPAFREIDFGRWEGLAWSQIEQLDPLYAELWVRSFPALSTPGGENFSDFERRVLKAVDDLGASLKLDAESVQRIAVVTHAGVLRVILERLCGATPEQAWEQSRQFCAIISCSGSICALADSVQQKRESSMKQRRVDKFRTV